MADEFEVNKLESFPKKADAVIQAAETGELDTTYPISVELSLTFRCNLNCIWCSDAAIRKKFKGDLDNQVAKKLITDLSNGGTKGVVFEGGGEPTLSPHLGEMVEHARGQNMATGLITNGTILPPEECLRSLEWTRISLDASTPEQIKQLKGRDVFNQILDNIKAMRRNAQDLVIGISYILSENNMEGAGELVRGVRDLVNYIQFKPVVDHPELSPVDIAPIRDLKTLETDTCSIYTDALDDNSVTGNGKLPCIAHSITSVIGADGDVYICGRLNQINGWLPIGNLHSASFNEMWNGRVRESQATLLNNTEICSNCCPECRIYKFNRDIYEGKIKPPYKKDGHKTPNFI